MKTLILSTLLVLSATQAQAGTALNSRGVGCGVAISKKLFLVNVSYTMIDISDLDQWVLAEPFELENIDLVPGRKYCIQGMYQLEAGTGNQYLESERAWIQ